MAEEPDRRTALPREAMEPEERESLSAFMSENWEAFSSFDAAVDRTVTRVGRDLDPSFHDFVLTQLVSTFATGGFSRRSIRTVIVVDSNILFGDCRRVALGRPSSTSRMFKSPYLELWGPPELREEVLEKIETELPADASKPRACAHAKKLLDSIHIKAPTELAALVRARGLIAGKDPDDVPFLALAFEVGAHVVASRDAKSIGSQSAIPRWDIGNVAKVVGTTEGGGLSLVVVGATAEAVAAAAEQVFISVAAAVDSALRLVAAAIGMAVEGVADLISRIPPDVRKALLVVGAGAAIGVGLGMLFSENFREAVFDGLAELGSKVTRFVRWVMEAVTRILTTIYALLVALWNIMLPVTAGIVTVAGVLIRRIWALLQLCAERSGG